VVVPSTRNLRVPVERSRTRSSETQTKSKSENGASRTGAMPVSGGEKPCELAPTNPVREDGGARSQGGPPVTGSRVFCSGVVSAPPLARAQRSHRHRDRQRDLERSGQRSWASTNSSARTIPMPGPPVAISSSLRVRRFGAITRTRMTFAMYASSMASREVPAPNWRRLLQRKSLRNDHSVIIVSEYIGL
jgi:hypothetical protein